MWEGEKSGGERTFKVVVFLEGLQFSPADARRVEVVVGEDGGRSRVRLFGHGGSVEWVVVKVCTVCTSE